MLDQDTAGRHSGSSQRVGYAKSRETRAQILAAALAEATERGLQHASVSRIAARANTAVGSLNYHFGSRNELLRELMRQLMADLDARLAAVGVTEDADFFTRHRADVLAYVQYVRANPAHTRLADEIKFVEPELYRQGIENWVGLLKGRLRAGIADGSVRPLDDIELSATAHFLVGARQFLEDLVAEVERDEQIVDAYLRLVCEGLGGPAVRRKKGRSR